MKSLIILFLSALSCLAQMPFAEGIRAQGIPVASAAWTPQSISGLSYWFDANDFVQADGTLIGVPGGLAWTNLANTSATATNTSSSVRPYITNNFFGSLPAVYSVGSKVLNCYLGMSSIQNVPGATFVGVVYYHAATTYGHAFFVSNGSANSNARFSAGAVGSGVQGGRARRQDADAGVNANAAIVNDQKYVLSVVCDYVGGTIKVYTNGVSGVAGNLATSGGNCANTTPVAVSLFANGATGESMNGAVGGFAVWNSALSDSDRQNAEAYYKDRFGFTY